MSGGAAILYRRGQKYLLADKERVGSKIAMKLVTDKNKTETSHRMYKPQKHYFSVPDPLPTELTHPEHAVRRSDFTSIHKPMIWCAFDTPELLLLTLRDAQLNGRRPTLTPENLAEAEHWIRECRYWRCIGISNPFLDDFTPRAYAWRNRNETGTVKLSRGMREAVLDMERALKRKELGLAPDYLWDKWGPSGFVDGSRADYLPRMLHNQYVDPDGVEVQMVDIEPFTTHEQLKERYAAFIEPDYAAFAGAFMASTNGGISIADVAEGSLVDFYRGLKEADGASPDSIDLADVQDLRTLILVASNDDLRAALSEVHSWSELCRVVTPEMMAPLNEKVDFARLLRNTRDDVVRVRRFFEEKCGFHNFMNTPDKEITGAVGNCLEEIRTMIETHDWAAQMASAVSELEWRGIMGDEAFELYSNLEDSITDRRRRQWATRFAGEANEEKTLDYMLENFGKRADKMASQSANAMGDEYDRESEPIGRSVQRRVLDSDKKQSKGSLEGKKKEGYFRRKSSADPLARLHKQQVFQMGGFGVH